MPEEERTLDEDSENESAPTNKWTVMFLIAGDNELAPLLISQLKAIKDAGFHKNVDVLVHFDPSEKGVPTKLLHVNRKGKLTGSPRTMIGDGGNSFVTNMVEDALIGEDIVAKPGTFAAKIKESLGRSDKIPALQAMENFLGFCRENHRAKNYVLFLFGHGLVVGNDAFLPDNNPKSAISLPELGTSLRDFATGVKGDGGKFPLLAMHSCAMSAVEVAYELKGTADYMIGSEGISWVGSWPYRNLLVKLFTALKHAEDAAKEKAEAEGADPKAAVADADIKAEGLMEKIFDHAMHNTTDFAFAGYSHELALCSLKPELYDPLTEDVRTLVARLKSALHTERGKEMILLAHWEAQSYWEENYTDLYDFCFCLQRRCASLTGMLGDGEKFQEVVEELGGLGAACGALMKRLEPKDPKRAGEWLGPVVETKSIGSQYQYSHGLSVYFPWSEPLADEPPPPPPAAFQSQRRAPDGSAISVLKNYAEYAFSTEFGEDSWLSFLKVYFKETRRRSRQKEDGGERKDLTLPIFKALARAHYYGALEKPTGGTEKPTGGSGSSCTCPSIKNYPTEQLDLEGGKQVEAKAFFISEGLLERKDRNRVR